MRLSICFVALFVLTCPVLYAAQPIVGEVVKVFTKDVANAAVNASVGDSVEFSVQGGTYPGGLIKNLKVEITGDALKKVGVWIVPVVSRDGQRGDGGIDMSAFIRAAKGGEATVSITPQGDISGHLAKKKTFTFTVKASREMML